jgi:6-pyruvoyltetrahydropterin/6-carboxytetrahydropterin synthase
MKTIRRRLKRFSAMHKLPGVPKGHKCANEHGHNYSVWVEVCGPLDEKTGFIIDTSILDSVWVPLHSMLDHQPGGLNAVAGLENPTTEILAAWIHERFARALADFEFAWIQITVCESEDSEATCIS